MYYETTVTLDLWNRTLHVPPQNTASRAVGPQGPRWQGRPKEKMILSIGGVDVETLTGWGRISFAFHSIETSVFQTSREVRVLAESAAPSSSRNLVDTNPKIFRTTIS